MPQADFEQVPKSLFTLDAEKVLPAHSFEPTTLFLGETLYYLLLRFSFYGLVIAKAIVLQKPS